MIEVSIAWLTVLLAGLALWTAMRRDRAASRTLLRGAAAAAMAGAVVRAWITGHLPKFGTFEESLACAAVILVHASVLARNADRVLPAAVAGAVGALLLLHGLAFPLTRYPLTISEQSLWLDLHVFMAWLCAAAFAMVVGGGVWILMRGGQAAEALTARSLQMGFLFHSLLMLAGAWYGYRLFGKVFVFDPVEILAVVSWVVTASVLHMKSYHGARNARFAGLSLVAAVTLFMSFRLLLYLSPASTYHIIDLDLKLHG